MSKAIKALSILILTALFAVSCTKPDVPNNDGNGENNDTLIETHEFVDLGLPSGTLWATCNVGANSSEECGDYYAWGETTTKDIYDWKSYKYSGFVNGRYELTKYCTDSCCGFNGFVDNLTVLELVDDAVRVNWGENWRMPTKEEWDELYRNTTYEWTVQNGVEGRLLTGCNGNNIFLPVTGFHLDGEFINTVLGIYWSSTLQTGSQMSAWSLHFDYENCHVCGTYERSRGQVVRAVRAAR